MQRRACPTPTDKTSLAMIAIILLVISLSGIFTGLAIWGTIIPPASTNIYLVLTYVVAWGGTIFSLIGLIVTLVNTRHCSGALEVV